MLKPTTKNTQHDIQNLFDTLKELSVKNKTLSIADKELSKEIFTAQITTVLTNTYNTLNHLDEKRIINGQVIKFENSRDSINSYISDYSQLAKKAKENEDETLAWRYEFIVGFYAEFQRVPETALQTLRFMISGNLILEDKEYSTSYLAFLEKHNQEEFKKVSRLYTNKDLFIRLYAQLEGYKISHEQIIKSAGLKIFNFFNVITKVQKTKLADRIEHIFASLEEEVKIDSKRASDIRVIGEFNQIVLLDYAGNKKSALHDFGLSKVLDESIATIIKNLKNTPHKAVANRLEKNRHLLEKKFIQQLLS